MREATGVRGGAVLVSAGRAIAVRRPAAGAAMRCASAGAALGAVALGSALLVVLRLLETWRIEPDAVANQVSLLGARLSYPSANAAAVVVLCQALLGLAVLVEGGRATLRELRAARRFSAWVRPRVASALGDVLVIEHDGSEAFCAGLLRPRIYVSTAAVAALDEQALRAVLDHERGHQRRHDPLRLSAGRVLARSLFFVPGFRRLAAQHESLAELSADEYAIAGSPEARRALARAMLAFDDRTDASRGAGIDPARVDALLGNGPAQTFPLLACLAAAGALAVLVLTAALIGRVATGAATLAVPFLSGQPCVLVLALMPALLGWTAWRLAQRRRAR